MSRKLAENNQSMVGKGLLNDSALDLSFTGVPKIKQWNELEVDLDFGATDRDINSNKWSDVNQGKNF